MIALLAAGRPGRGPSETYYTVPWCPLIATHPIPQLPGAALKLIARVVEICRQHGMEPTSIAVSTGDLLVGAFSTGKFAEAFVISETLRMMRELQMFPERAEEPS